MNYLQIFADKEALLEPFDDAERGRLLSAMLAYALRDELLPLTGNERYIWPVFREMIDRSREALEKKQSAGRGRQSAQASTSQQTTADDQHKPAQASTSQQESSTSQQATADDQHQAAQAPMKQETRNKNQESRDKIQEPEGREKRARFSPPTAEDVSAYAQGAGLRLNAERFVDFYASKGWKVGSSPMRDWRAAARNWAARDDAPKAASPPPRQLRDQLYSQREYQDTGSMTERMAQALQKLKGGAP